MNRIIPCLLIKDDCLVKTINFSDPIYLGDPLNAVRIFNEKEVDELIVLDIDPSSNSNRPNYELIKDIAAECNMPFTYGGGITSLEQAQKIISLGVEKIAIGKAALENFNLVSEISNSIGSQSLAIIINVKKNLNLYEVFSDFPKYKNKIDIIDYSINLQNAGAGEIIINSISLDGCLSGYDLDLAKILRKKLTIPMTMIGGAGSHEHIANLFSECNIVGAAAGSLFTLKGAHRAVLINYPNAAQKNTLLLKKTSGYENI